MTQMEEPVQQCDMEVMKMAMLRHEETFRQQVHDLHRLYRVQKQLMGDLSGHPSVPPCRQVQRRRQHPRRPELSLQLPVDDDEYTVVSAGTDRLATPPSREIEDELELTLAVGGGGGSRSQRKRRESATPSATDCSGRRSPQTPSSSTDSDDALRTVQRHHQRATACDLRGGAMVKQPQWLVRCLSLRMA